MPAPKRPNIILIIADQFRADALGIDGNRFIHTPNLDFLGTRGTRFTHAYTPCPSCIPARAMLMTGMNQWHTGILSMAAEQPDMPNDYPHTLAGEMTGGGYQTHLSGKGHFTPQYDLMGFETTEVDEAGRVETPGFKDAYRTWFERHVPAGVTPDDHGVDFNSWCAREWHLAEYLHPTAWTMMSAIEFLKRRDQSRPFFLNISFDRPHSPYVPPRAYWEMYKDGPLPPPYVGDWSQVNEDPEAALDPNTGRGKLSEGAIRRARGGYYGEISFVDAQIGRLMMWLRRYQPEARGNTCFIFVSDHGDMQGDHHLWRKGKAYEGSARVPFLVLPPEGMGGTRHVADEPVSLADVMPTILDYAGLPIPSTVEGYSVAGLAKEPAKKWREYIHGEHGNMHYVTDGKQKLVWYPYEDREQFFDLATDPGECQDLIHDPLYTYDVTRWRDRLAKELAGRGCGWVKNGKPYYPGSGPLVSSFASKRWDGRG